ncbi:MAG: DUF924 domain-containing protein [Magnetococcales bacterium]|nr:DUF924 domain-containing protein [Magnetococcales bacterium]
MSAINSVISFWFGERDSEIFGQFRQEWFKKSAEFDGEIRDKFSQLHQQANSGELDDWQSQPEGALALIIILDQFSRNMFRNSPEAFASDPQALTIAKKAIEASFHNKVHPVMRPFFFLPLEHSEKLEDQQQCVSLFEQSVDKNGLTWAIKHLEIIQRFGRFPHRNSVLGRTSSPEEEEFLQQPGSSF